MPDQSEVSAPQDLSATIDSSLCSIWSRHTGSRPSGSSVELSEGVVRWTIPGSPTGVLKKAIAEHNEQQEGPVRTLASFERETSAAVSKAMHRKVTARFDQKRKDDTTTQVFILEVFPTKF